MTSKNTFIVTTIILLVIIGGWYYFSKTPSNISGPLKIGVITDLSGGAAYWGESTRVGAQMAVQELDAKGISTQLVFEDYALDAAKAASAAQKLSAVDKVNGVYVEFNPGAIAASSVLKSTDIPYIYDAAITSPLGDSQNAFKTYLDYQAGCHAIAQEFKDNGVSTIGMLKVNQEFGELCLKGVQEVFGANTLVEGYNLGDTDFRTQIAKLKSEKAGAVINVGFEGDTYNTLSGMKTFGYNVPFGTVDDTITDKVKNAFPNQLKGTRTFGFENVDSAFATKAQAANGGATLGSLYAAALAYTHVLQLGEALFSCDSNNACIDTKIANSPADSTIGFMKYSNRIADLNISTKQY